MTRITGITEYKNLSSQQHDRFYEVFDKFIKEINPERILEIGTAGGGSTLALNDMMTDIGKPGKIRTYEVHEQRWYDRLRECNIDLRLENIFNHAYNALNEEKKQEVVDYIQQPGITLVLCDGGHKIGEFNELSNYLKPGDYIMAHDYSESYEYFKDHIENKIWNWCEITEKDISEASERNNLKRYMAEEFQSIVWICKVKQ